MLASVEEARMRRSSPYRIVLTAEERAGLEARARSYSSPYRDVIRARMVLMAADGLDNHTIGARRDTPRQIVSKWRKRFYEAGLAGLDEQPRGGRPATFPREVVIAVKALACELPATTGVPLGRWHCPDLARAAVEQGITAAISDTTIWRWLTAARKARQQRAERRIPARHASMAAATVQTRRLPTEPAESGLSRNLRAGSCLMCNSSTIDRSISRARSAPSH
jgi:transposase